MAENAQYPWYRLAALTLAVLLAVAVVSCGTADHSAAIEKHKALAGDLHSNRLYKPAIDEYRQALAFDDLSDGQRANINYLIARIYYEDLKDYEHAAAYYLRAREYDPEGSFMTEASKNLVASLEKLGNVIDAKRQLESATDVDAGPANDSDVVVARIGKRNIWLSDIDDQITLLPPEVQKQLLDRDKKAEFVRQFVGVELIYDAAVREDYLSDPEIEKQKERMIKGLVVDRFVSDKIMPRTPADSADLHNFYKANKDSLYAGVPYDSVASRVYRDYQSQKAEQAYHDYIQRLVKAEDVEFKDYNVR